jgi:hydroxymethylbilane synthase
VIRIATRASALATAQAAAVGEVLADHAGEPFELVLVTTDGDRSTAPVASMGTTGVFVAAVRQAVAEGAADLAVHSMKDLPTAPADGLRIAAVPTREDRRDALCGGRLADLPAGAAVGTGSPRRAALLLDARPDLHVVPIRGNVDSRLARVGQDLAAVVVAAAGLHRLGRIGAADELLDPQQFVPAPAQGALALECRTDLADPGLLAALERIADPAAAATAIAERSVLAALEAGCTAPVGATADIEDTEITVTAAVGNHPGEPVLRMTMTGRAQAPRAVGEHLARQLLNARATGRGGTP